MQAIKEKLSNVASSAKEHMDVHKAKAEEKVEKATARNDAEKEIAHERRKAKEAEAKMEMHTARAENKAMREHAKHSHEPLVGTHDHNYPGTAVETVPADEIVMLQEHRGHGHPPQTMNPPAAPIDPSHGYPPAGAGHPPK